MTLVHSLRFRLALLLVLVALAPVGTAAFLIQRATADAFNDYSIERAKADAQSIVTQIDALTGQQFVVLDSSMAVVAGAFGGAGNGVPGDVANNVPAPDAHLVSNKAGPAISTGANVGSIS